MVDDKTNEITVIPEILKKLCIEGAIVTLDAMGCQSAIAEQIIEQKGDYILRVKANQGQLHEAMKRTFEQGENLQYQAMTYYKAKDETNNDHVLPLMYLFGMKLKWKGLKSLVLVISERETHEEKTEE